ncbi:trypsin-like cysteine/serine peptidase domain-containing protein, partial [Kickxella alabastrina]|uniref:trypsin-like cysteine/serine peptidase domain-containing protein n=1 Tax=Kickxella alabastrina TaxID=61397 RepID=UPI00221EEC19
MYISTPYMLPACLLLLIGLLHHCVTCLPYSSSSLAPSTITKRIINGVSMPDELASATSICGGTILSPNHISPPLTAKQISVTAKKITIHPDYNHDATDGLADMAVIEVDTIVFGKQAQKMPVYKGQLIPAREGKHSHGPDRAQGRRGGNWESHFVILTPNRSTCQGDSGTTVAVSKDNALMLVGLVSIAINLTDDLECGNVQSAHMYVHIAYFMDFLVSTTGLTVDYLT